MKALVLSGGSIKGCYQAGAVRRVLADGFAPDIITGISVGALNAAYLGKASVDHDWPVAGRMLANFWINEVTEPAKVMRKRHLLELAWRIWQKDWDGLISTTALTQLVNEVLKPYPTVVKPIVRVGYVPMRTGELTYLGPESPEFIDAVLASSAEPIAMPLRKVRDLICYDGGLRDIAPLKQAISLGATDIVAVLCQPVNLAVTDVKEGDLLQLLARVLSIVTNEIIRNDVAQLERVNQQLEQFPDAPSLAGKRPINLRVIRPDVEPAIDLEHFTREEIRAMVDLGDRDATAA